MRGVVTSYNSGTRALVVDVREAFGSGTYTAWTLSPSNQLLAADLRTTDLQMPRAVPRLLLWPGVVEALGWPSGVTYTRAGPKWVRNAAGIWVQLAANAAPVHRADSREAALWLEPSVTNYLTRSQAFDNAAWTKTNSTISSGFYSPDGLSAARKINATATNAAGASADFAVASMPAGPVTLSVFALLDTTQWICLELSSGASFVRQWFNVGSTPSVGASTASTFALSGARQQIDTRGLRRCEMTINLPTTQALTAKIIAVDGNSSLSVSAGVAVQVWQAACENYYHATSPIVTSGSTVTRAADVLNWPGFGAALTGSPEVSIVATAASGNYINTSIGFAALAYPAVWAFGPNGNRVNVYGPNAEGTLGAGATYNNFGGVPLSKNAYGVQLAAAGGQSRFALNGAAPINASGTGLGAITALNIGHNAGAQQFAGLLYSLEVYSQALSDSNLIAITTTRPA
jgi:hypothetical protein